MHHIHPRHDSTTLLLPDLQVDFTNQNPTTMSSIGEEEDHTIIMDQTSDDILNVRQCSTPLGKKLVLLFAKTKYTNYNYYFITICLEIGAGVYLS